MEAHRPDQRLKSERIETLNALLGPAQAVVQSAEIDLLLALACDVLAVDSAGLTFIQDGYITVTNAFPEKSGGVTLGRYTWEDSICPWLLMPAQQQAMVVEALTDDNRFSHLPWAGTTHSYASAPLVASNGQRLGSCCINSSRPNKNTAARVCMLNNLTELVVRELERHCNLANRLGSTSPEEESLKKAYSKRVRPLSALASCVALVDIEAPGMPILYANSEFERLTGHARGSVIHTSLQELLSPEAEQVPCSAPAAFSASFTSHTGAFGSNTSRVMSLRPVPTPWERVKLAASAGHCIVLPQVHLRQPGAPTASTAVSAAAAATAAMHSHGTGDALAGGTAAAPSTFSSDAGGSASFGHLAIFATRDGRSSIGATADAAAGDVQVSSFPSSRSEEVHGGGPPATGGALAYQNLPAPGSRSGISYAVQHSSSSQTSSGTSAVLAKLRQMGSSSTQRFPYAASTFKYASAGADSAAPGMSSGADAVSEQQAEAECHSSPLEYDNSKVRAASESQLELAATTFLSADLSNLAEAHTQAHGLHMGHWNRMFDVSFRPAAQEVLDEETVPVGVPVSLLADAREESNELRRYVFVHLHPTGPHGRRSLGSKHVASDAMPSHLANRRPGELHAAGKAPFDLESVASIVPGLRLHQVLGKGGYGTVYAGTWHGMNVAAKVQDFPAARTSLANYAAAEVESNLGRRMQHPNVVSTLTHVVQVLPLPSSALPSTPPSLPIFARPSPPSITAARSSSIAPTPASASTLVRTTTPGTKYGQYSEADSLRAALAELDAVYLAQEEADWQANSAALVTAHSPRHQQQEVGSASFTSDPPLLCSGSLDGPRPDCNIQTGMVAGIRPDLRVLTLQELCQHGSLQLGIDRGWFRLGPQQASPVNMPLILHTLLGILNGVAYLHSQGIIHADLSAQNVLLAAPPQLLSAPPSMTSPMSSVSTNTQSRPLATDAAVACGLPVAHAVTAAFNKRGDIANASGQLQPSNSSGPALSPTTSDLLSATALTSFSGRSPASSGKPYAPTIPSRGRTGVPAFMPKIADFGKARQQLEGDTTVLKGAAATITCMPPEALIEGIVSCGSDVYAVGVLAWQMYTGCRPYANMRQFEIIRAIAEGRLLQFPQSTPQEYKAFATSCWRPAAKRPTAAQLRSELERLLQWGLSSDFDSLSL